MTTVMIIPIIEELERMKKRPQQEEQPFVYIEKDQAEPDVVSDDKKDVYDPTVNYEVMF